MDDQRFAQCISILEASAEDVLAQPATRRMDALKESTPGDCQSTDAYKTVQAALLIELDRLEDAEQILGEINLHATSVPRALELAYILAVEGGWESPVEPKALAERYIDIQPGSPIGHVLLARELSEEKRNPEMLRALEKSKALVTSENERAHLVHLITFSGYYATVGDYPEAYRLSYLLFSLYGDDVWVRHSPVILAAKVSIMVGRRDEARLIMDQLVLRNPQAATTTSALSVFKELAEQRVVPHATLSPQQPTIESLLASQSPNHSLKRTDQSLRD